MSLDSSGGRCADDPPLAVRQLRPLQKERHRVRRRIGGVFLGVQTEEDVAHRVGVARNADALQRAVAPDVDERANGLQARSRRRFVDRNAKRADRRDGHRRQRVVVARHTARLLQKDRIGPLQQRQGPLESHTGRRGRSGSHRRRGRCVAGRSARDPQDVDRRRAAVPPRDVQRGLPCLVAGVDVHALGDQQPERVIQSDVRRRGARDHRLAFAVRQLWIGAVIEQRFGASAFRQRRHFEKQRVGQDLRARPTSSSRSAQTSHVERSARASADTPATLTSAPRSISS